MEIWRPIPEWEHYLVSSCGRVKRSEPSPMSQTIGECRKLSISNTGYPFLVLTDTCGRRQQFNVHRLVAIAFIGNPINDKMEVNHIDSDRSNNHVSNLEWVTRGDNHRHAYKHGFANAKGESNGASRLTEEQIIEIRQIAKFSDRSTWLQFTEKYSITIGSVRAILIGKLWSHLPFEKHEPKSPPSGSKCRSAKLNEDDVIEIKRIVASGEMNRRNVAFKYNVNPSTIYRIFSGDGWTHV